MNFLIRTVIGFQPLPLFLERQISIAQVVDNVSIYSFVMIYQLIDQISCWLRERRVTTSKDSVKDSNGMHEPYLRRKSMRGLETCKGAKRH